MPATLTTVDAILKEIYAPRIAEQLQSEIIGLKRIEKTSDGVTKKAGGKYVDIPIRVSRNHGIGYRNENEALPAAGQQGYDEVHVGLKYGYGRVRLTNQLMDLADGSPQAFASGMDREMNGLKDDLVKDQSRIFYGDATGVMATITSAGAGASATHTVDNIQYLEIGAIVDVLVKSTGATVQLNTTVTAVNEATNVVTFADSFESNSANNHGLYRQGSYEREPSGLDLIVNDTAVLHTLDPSSQPIWAATVMANGGTNRALSESLMITSVDKGRRKGGKISVFLTSLGVRRAYFNLLTQQRRFPNTKEFAGGFTGLAFHHGREIPVVDDVDHPPNTMYGLDEDKFKFYRPDEGWHWADEDGSVLKWVTGYDAFEGFMRQYHELGTEHRRAHVKIEDITEA